MTPEFNLVLKARGQMIAKEPFFAYLAMQLDLVEDDAIPTMQTNGKEIRFNPAFVRHLVDDAPSQGNQYSFAWLIFVLCHEVWHCAVNHIGRREGRDVRKWQMAIDYETNAMLIDAGFVMPPEGLYEAAWGGISAEEIYAFLPDNNSLPSGKVLIGEVVPGDSQSGDSLESKAMQHKWQMALTTAIELAKGHGHIPAYAKTLVKDFTTPKVNWIEELHGYFQGLRQQAPTWAKPNKNHMWRDMYLPSVPNAPSMGTMVFFVDTSGSRYYADAMTRAISEIKGVIEQAMPARLVVICGDTQVTSVQEFEPGDDIEINFAGGGGTDFNDVFTWIETQALEPEIFVGLTDLEEADFPVIAPSYPVLWVATTSAPAPWGDVIRIED